MRLAFGSEHLCAPIVVGASGPKMLRLAGQIGDGVIVTRHARAGEQLQAMLTCVREGRAASARPERPFTVCLSAAAAVHDDRQQAIAAVRPHAARSLLTPLWSLDETARRASERVKASYDYTEHMNPGATHAQAIPGRSRGAVRHRRPPRSASSRSRACSRPGSTRSPFAPTPWTAARAER